MHGKKLKAPNNFKYVICLNLLMAHRQVKTGTGTSYLAEPELAGAEAARAAVSRLNTKPKFGFLFCSDKKYTKEAVTAVVRSAHRVFLRANPDIEWVGCTTPNVSGCIAIVADSENIHTSIGISNFASRLPLAAGEKAAKEALSKVNLDGHITSYLKSLADLDNPPEDVSNIHPFVLTLFAPNGVKSDEILRGISNVTGVRAPVFKGQGYTFSNGVVFKDAAILFLQAFDKTGDWYGFQNKLFSSVFGMNSLVSD